MAAITEATNGMNGANGAKKPNPQLQKAQDKLRATLAQFTAGQKTMTAIALLVVVVGGYAFMSWAGKPTYTPLFSNLSGTDAAAITAKLTSAKVPYQLTDGGATILVPSADVYQQRITMSAAGLPNSDQQGYSLLDKQGITTSQFQQQVDYQRAVEGELDKTIEAINGVQAAVVHVVIPQDNVFAGSLNKPSASVLVEMTPGQTLNASQVQAVVHLTASSIENLNPSDVTVTDQAGNVLAAPGSDSAALAGTSAEQQQTQAYEDSQSTSLQNDLSSVLGANMAVVHVAATLNFNQVTSQSKTYAKKAIPVSTNTSTETYLGAAQATQGGTLGNQTTNAGQTTTTPTPGTAGSNYKNQTVQQSNAVSETDSSVVASPGGVTHLSVAVLLNSSVKANPAAIQKFVAAAAGLDPRRGDVITVQSLQFDNSAEKSAAAALTAATAGKSQAALLATARTAMILIVVVFLTLFALRKLTRTVRTPLELPIEELELEEADIDDLDDDGRTLTTQMAALHHVDPELEAARARAALNQADAAALGDMIDQDPAAIAEMLREWLSEAR